MSGTALGISGTGMSGMALGMSGTAQILLNLEAGTSLTKYS